MNAIVALCHFCEQHGPATIMCTQPFRQPAQPKSSQSHLLSSLGPSSEVGIDVAASTATASGAASFGLTTSFWPTTELPDQAGSNPLHSIVSTSGAISSSTGSGTSVQYSPTNPPPTCRACSFVSREEVGLISSDRATHISYISNQWPKDAGLFAAVRHACVRSLSCEVCPGREGPIYFGDEMNGHAVSYNFHIKDSQARGFHGRFSILVLSWDRIYLLNVYPFLVSNIARMISRLQSASSQVYNDETAGMEVISGSGGASGLGPGGRPLSTVSCAGQPGRGTTPPPGWSGQALAAGYAVTAAAAASHHIPLSSASGAGSRQRRAADADMRSLCELTKDEQIFYRVHSWFTWLLRAAGRRWTNLPSNIAPPDEDVLILAEQQQHALECVAGLGSDLPVGSISSSKHSNSSSSENVKALRQQQNISSSHNSGSNLLSAGMNPDGGQSLVNPVGSVGNAQPAVGKSLHLTDGSASEETGLALHVLVRMCESLRPSNFSRLVQHVIIGNQIVVQPMEDSRLGPVAVTGLAKLLPKGCIQQILASPEYLAPFRCNLLSLTVDARLPDDDWAPGDGVLFLIVSCRQPAFLSEPQTVQGRFPITSFVESLHFALSPTFVDVRSATTTSLLDGSATEPAWPPLTPSTLVSQIIRLVSLKPILPTGPFDLALATVRQEWINRARLLYSFKRCQGPLLTGEEASRRWANVLACIDCGSAENAAVVKFWQGALSQQSRQNVCHMRRARPSTGAHSTSSATNSRRASFCSTNADLFSSNTLAAMSD